MDHCNKIGGSVRHGYNMTPKKRSGLVSAIAPVLVFSILASSCRTCLGEGQVQQPQSKLQFGQEDKTSASSTNLPRILTVLTTYNQRTQYIKAYREVAANRTDGYEPMIFVTSDEEDTDPDGVIDYKFEEPGVHRLLAAVKEVISRYSGQFDWIAAGDDDTVFMYKRAMALLRHIDPKQKRWSNNTFHMPALADVCMDDILQPIAIGLVHGTCDLDGHSRGRCQCFTPEERSANSTMPKAGSSCCLDITQPCEVPRLPERNVSESSLKRFCKGGISIYDGDLYWPYGGSGFFMSSGLIEAIDADGDGWEVCRQMFGRASNTDMQVGRCLLANGFTMSSFEAGFHKIHSAELEKIRDTIASECQIIGVHAGLRHRRSDMEYTTDDFKATVSTIWAEDDAKPWLSEGSLETECPETWATVSKWIK